MTALASVDTRNPHAAQSAVGLRLALAGGGTGGHVVPGLHLLAELRAPIAPNARDAPIELADLVWFGSGREAEDRALAGLPQLAEPAPIERVRLELEPAGGGAPSLAGLALRLAPAVARARAALLRHRSEVALGLGGFTSLPVVLAARAIGIPCCLLEINAVRGKATRWLSPAVQRVLHAWPDSLPTGAPIGRHVCVGPPLAPGFSRSSERTAADERAARAALNFDPARPLLIVLGGSQGARALNSFAAGQARYWLDQGLQILHQVGPGRLAESAPAAAGYRALEFLEPMQRVLGAATVVLTRGGASTLAEIGALGIPAVVVPYPHHPDRHQAHNARQLGAGVVCVDERELGSATAAELAQLCAPERAAQRLAMSRALRAAVPRGAAAHILEVLAELAQRARPQGVARVS